MFKIIEVFFIIFLFIAFVFLICTIPVYIFNDIRARRLKKVADKFKLKYEKHYNFLTLYLLSRRFFGDKKTFPFILLKRHILSGEVNNHKIEIFDCSYENPNYFTFLFFSLMLRRTVVHIDEKEEPVHWYMLSVNKIESILNQL